MFRLQRDRGLVVVKKKQKERLSKEQYINLRRPRLLFVCMCGSI